MKDLTVVIVDTDKIKLDHVNMFVQGHYMTIIMAKIYLPKNGHLELSREELIGWYYGEPNKEDYSKYMNRLKATYEV